MPNALDISPEDIVAEGRELGKSPQEIAGRIRQWRTDALNQGAQQFGDKDPAHYAAGVDKLDEHVGGVLSELRGQATQQWARSTFAERPQEFENFLHAADNGTEMTGAGFDTEKEEFFKLQGDEAFRLPKRSQQWQGLSDKNGVELGRMQFIDRGSEQDVLLNYGAGDGTGAVKQARIAIPTVQDGELSSEATAAEERALAARDKADRILKMYRENGVDESAATWKSVDTTAKAVVKDELLRAQALRDPQQGRALLTSERVMEKIRTGPLKDSVGQSGLAEDMYRGMSKFFVSSRVAVNDLTGDTAERDEWRGHLQNMRQYFPGSTGPKNTEGVRGFISDAAEGAGGMTPQVLAMAAGGVPGVGAGLMKGIGAASMTSMGVNAYGGAVDDTLNRADQLDADADKLADVDPAGSAQLREQAASVRDQYRGIAAVKAGVEVASEMILPEHKLLTGGASSALKRVGSAAGKSMLEGAAAEIGNQAVNNAVYGDPIDISQIARGAALEAAAGASMIAASALPRRGADAAAPPSLPISEPPSPTSTQSPNPPPRQTIGGRPVLITPTSAEQAQMEQMPGYWENVQQQIEQQVAAASPISESPSPQVSESSPLSMAELAMNAGKGDVTLAETSPAATAPASTPGSPMAASATAMTAAEGGGVQSVNETPEVAALDNSVQPQDLEPLGMMRLLQRDPLLEQMDDASFKQHFKAAEAKINAIEDRYDAAPEMADDPAFRRQMGLIQDQFVAAELESFRRDNARKFAGDVFVDFTQLVERLGEPSLENDSGLDAAKARVLWDVLQAGGLTEQQSREGMDYQNGALSRDPNFQEVARYRGKRAKQWAQWFTKPAASAAPDSTRLQFSKGVRPVSYLQNIIAALRGSRSVAANAVFDLGMPGTILQRAGVPSLPLRLRRGVFRRKTNKHTELTEAALLALPDALQNPMAVFVSPGDRKAHGIVTVLQTPAGPVTAYFTVRELNGESVLEAKTVFGKDVQRLLAELKQAERQQLLTYVDKGAFDSWLAQGDGASRGNASAQHGQTIEGLRDFFAQFDTESKPRMQPSAPNVKPLRATRKAVLDALTLLKDRLPGLQHGRVLTFANAAEFLASGYAGPQSFTAEEIDGMADAEAFYDQLTGHTIVFTDQITLRSSSDAAPLKHRSDIDPRGGYPYSPLPQGSGSVETPMRAVARVLLHERVGHEGVNTLLQQDASARDRWNKIASLIPAAELDGIAAEAGYAHLAGDRAQLALEWLARKVESVEGARNAIDIERNLAGTARQLWQALKEMLARAFAGFSRSAAFAHEVHEIINLARAAAMNGTAVPTSAEALAQRVQFSMAAGEQVKQDLTFTTVPPHSQTNEQRDDIDAYNASLRADAQRAGLPPTVVEARELRLGDDGGRGSPAIAGFGNALRTLFGKRIVFVRAVQGMVPDGAAIRSRSNALFLSTDRKQPVMYLAGHEFGHALEHQNPGLYQELKTAVLAAAGDRSAFSKQLASYGYDASKHEVEFVNDFIGGQWMEPTFWRELEARKPGHFTRLAQSALQWLDGLLDRVRSLPRDVSPYFKDIQKARDTLQQVMIRFHESGRFPERTDIQDADDSALVQASHVRHTPGTPFEVRNLMVRALLTSSPLATSMRDTLAETKNEKDALDHAAARIGKMIELGVAAVVKRTGTAVADIYQLVNDVFDGKPQAHAVLQTVDETLAEAARRGRALLDEMSSTIGLYLPAGTMRTTIMQNLGSWMRRGYAVFDAGANWNYKTLRAAADKDVLHNGQDARKLMQNAVKHIVSQNSKLAGQVGLHGLPRADTELSGILIDLLDRDTTMNALIPGRGNTVRKDVSSLIRRKEIAPAIRALMGEHTSPMKRYAASASFQTQFLAKYQAQARMRQVGLATGLFSTTQTDTYHNPIPEADSWGPLAGLYTTPELLAAMQQTSMLNVAGSDMPSLIGKAYKAILANARMNMVALNPKSTVVNFTGGAISSVASGDVLAPGIVERFRKAITMAWRDGTPTKADMVNAHTLALRDVEAEERAFFIGSGLLNNNLTLAEIEANTPEALMSLLGDSNAHLANAAVGAAHGMAAGNALGRVAGTVGQGVGIALGGAVGAVVGGKNVQAAYKWLAERLVSKPDTMWKVAAFYSQQRTALLAGMTPADAAKQAVERVRNTYPDYSKIHPLIRHLSLLPLLGNFVSFPHELVRNLVWNYRYAKQDLASGNAALRADALRRIAGSSAAYLLSTPLLNAAGTLLFGWLDDDDEREDIVREWLAPDYEKDAALTFKSVNADGVTYFKQSSLIPQGIFGDMIFTAAKHAGDGEISDAILKPTAMLLSQLGIGQNIFNTLVEAASGEDKYNRRIYSDHDNAAVKLLKGGDHVTKTFTDPGYAKIIEEMVRHANSGNTEELGRLGNGLMGVRDRRLTWDKAVTSAYYKFRSQIQAVKDDAKQQLDPRNKHLLTQSTQIVNGANAAIAEIEGEIARFESDMGRLPIPAGVVSKARREVLPRKISRVEIKP